MYLMTPRLMLLALFLIWSTGCATTSPEQPEIPFDVPATWLTEVEPEPPRDPSWRWWQTFEDPQLEALVPQVLENNQTIRQVAARVEIAAARARISSGDKWPTIAASFDAGTRQQVFVGLPIPGDEGGVLSSRSESFSALVSMSWEADLWGRIRHQEAAAIGRVAAAESEFDAALLSLVGQTAKAWFTATELAQQRQLAAETLESLTATRERVAQRYRSGVAPSLELRLARTNEARAQALLARRERQLESALSVLNVLSGTPRSSFADRAREETSGLVPVPPAIPAGLPAELLTRRPDLQALERQLLARGHDVVSAHRALYPRLTLTGAGGTSSNALEDLLDGDFSIWSLAGSLLQPLFQGGKLRAAEDLALAERDRALAAYLEQLLVAFSEVETALSNEQLLAAEERALAVAEAEAETATAQAESRYLAGIGSYLVVLESQRQWFAVRGDRLAVQRAQLTNRIDLHLALGGDLEPSSDSISHTDPTLDSTPVPPPAVAAPRRTR